MCSCSNFPAEAMLWIKEVELTNSVDDLKSSCSTWRTAPFFDLELLDARIASALNIMIQNSYLKKKVSLEEHKAQTQDRFLRETQTAYLFYDYFRVTDVNDYVLDYADCFTVTLRNDNIQEFDTRRWRNFDKQCSRSDLMRSWKESEKLKTVLELYNVEIYQHKSKPDTMVKRNIEHELRSRNFESRNERTESHFG